MADKTNVQPAARLVIATTSPWAWESVVDQVELNGFRVEIATGVSCSIEAAMTRADLFGI